MLYDPKTYEAVALGNRTSKGRRKVSHLSILTYTAYVKDPSGIPSDIREA
jgi:hypothetical protein